ncbi:fumarylacetoacetate hydrolase family protein [Celerinatantimonas sp. YJH-8]|uniref:fumarylacetoacetate hydrolase family protein n=1 Tax=Celerinatantimonas sp. YJH-8 TaxID=3228714 RepID=UPI0038C5E091
MYQHTDILGNKLSFPCGKIVCVGQNYAAHIQEMNSNVSKQAVFFIKPSTAACPLAPTITIPSNQGACHHELELALLIKSPLKNATPEQALAAVGGFTLALDLTLRDVQKQLKEKGHPWERAKGFDGAAPLGPWLIYQNQNLQQLKLSLFKNDELIQTSSTDKMLRDCATLLAEASECFTLCPGDVLLTGTPAGVGALTSGDRLNLVLDDLLEITTEVIVSAN